MSAFSLALGKGDLYRKLERLFCGFTTDVSRKRDKVNPVNLKSLNKNFTNKKMENIEKRFNLLQISGE